MRRPVRIWYPLVLLAFLCPCWVGVLLFDPPPTLGAAPGVCGGKCGAGSARKPPTVRQRIRAASITVWASTGKGSATLFAGAKGERWGITAAHVVEADRFVRIARVTTDEDGRETAKWVWVRVVVASKKQDIALLEVGAGCWPDTVAAHCGPTPGPDTPVFHCGTYFGRCHQSVARGEIQRIGADLDGGGLYDQADFTALPGSSGGGVFTERGEWIGLLTHIGRATGRPVWFVPVRRVRRWLNEVEAPFRLPEGIAAPRECACACGCRCRPCACEPCECRK